MQDFYGYKKLTWENSLEGVLSRLDIVNIYNANNFKDEIFIVKTLLRLPEDIREKVLKEVSFILMTDETVTIKKCMHILMNRKDLRDTNRKDQYITSFKRTFIILNFKNIKDWEKMDAIAYEIAHFIVGYHDSQYYDKDYEDKIKPLLEEWGFERKNHLRILKDDILISLKNKTYSDDNI